MQRRVLQELSDDWNESVNLNFENSLQSVEMSRLIWLNQTY